MLNSKNKVLVRGEVSTGLTRAQMLAMMQSASTAKTADIIAHIDEQMKQQQKQQQEAKRQLFKQELQKLGIEGAFDGVF